MMSLRRLTIGATALLLAACGSLDVSNPNEPDAERAIATPEDVKNVAISSVNSWYLTSTYIEPYMMLGVTADQLTANFGNFGMRFNNLQPRIPYENSSAGGDRGVTESPWENNYSTLGAANDALRAFGRGIVLETPAETEKYKHLAQFVQAASLSNLALIFDQAFVVDESFVPGESEAPVLQPYGEVSAAALAKWDALLADLSGKNNTYVSSGPSAVLPVTSTALNSGTLRQIAATLAAATLAYTPRNAQQAGAVDWDKVRQYAEQGISGTGLPRFDLVIQGDFNNWYSYINYYGNERTWVRVDMKLIHAMDATEPVEYRGPTDIVAPAASGNDNRIRTDYAFANGVIGDPGRGVYMQSPFYHSRYVAHARTSSPTNGRAPVPYLLAAENDLLLAEALIRGTTKDLARAATLINNTRVTRGGLAAATAADGEATLLSYINYERKVELLNTNGFYLFRARHFDDLQDGTVRHLPIPAKELETLRMDIYTFGGVGKPTMTVLAPTGELLPLHTPMRTQPPRDGIFRYE